MRFDSLEIIAEADFDGSLAATLTAGLIVLEHFYLDAGKPAPRALRARQPSTKWLLCAAAALVAYRSRDPVRYQENLPYLRRRVFGSAGRLQ